MKALMGFEPAHNGQINVCSSSSDSIFWAIQDDIKQFQNYTWLMNMPAYNAFNVYCRELAPGTVSLTGDRAQGDDSKHCTYSTVLISMFTNKQM